MRRLVHGMVYRYRLHAPLLPGKPDLVLTRHGKIIEVRGCFWRQRGRCIDSHVPKSRLEYWGPKLQRNVARDASNLRRLRRLGYRVLVVWECETKRPARLAARLRRFLAT